MANFDKDTQRKTSFFHSLGYVLTKDVNDPDNERYKSAHNVQSNEIWVGEINYCQDLNDAISEASNNPSVSQIGDQSTPALLYPLKDSNGQAWFLDTGNPLWDTNGYLPTSGWVKPFISPVDVPDSDGSPSNGFGFRLYNNNGNYIPPSEGRWEVDYYGSLLKFNVGYTPFKSGNLLGFWVDYPSLLNSPDKTAYLQSNGPRAIVFQYSGKLLNELIDEIKVYKVNSQKGMKCNLTEVDYDVATNELVKFEPFGEKSIDILINGVEIDNTDHYTFAEIKDYIPLSNPTLGHNNITVQSGEEPTIGEYLRFSDGTNFEYRRISSVNGQIVSYTSGNVNSTFNTVDKFKVDKRPDGRSKSGDILLWKGSSFYELENTDTITFEYITSDPLAKA